MQAKAEGADVRIVYSPTDSLKLAKQNPKRELVFFGLGFETTMPSTALTVLQAKQENIRNFSLYCNHITIPPTMRAILDTPDLSIDGFVGPGHVSMVIGTDSYGFIASEYGKPLVISGFEPLDVLQSIWMLIKQFQEGRCVIENQYGRVVSPQGNAMALQAVNQVFELRDHCEWRGLGSIEHSGVRMRNEFADFDAERKFLMPNQEIADPKECQCGEVLQGKIKPKECKIFGTLCTPEKPMGALMVSTEGACAAYYNYGDIRRNKEEIPA